MTSNAAYFFRQRSTQSLDEPLDTVSNGTRCHKPSWVTENFKKRECSRFIPKSPELNTCCCGQDKESHNANALLPPALQDSVWVSSRHSVASPTDAYGEIEFHGAGHYTRAKYIRLAHDTEPELAFDLLCNQWNISFPKLLISVTGGAKNFVLQPKLKRILRDGLLKAAQITGAWLITGGTNTGVMKHIGEAVRGHTVMPRGAQLKDRTHNVHLIGIASWGIVNDRDKLIDSQDVVAYQMTSSLQSKGACLDNNHSHFILVDNGTVNQYGVEITFRANLENCIARKTMDERCEKRVPVVLLVLEGGPNTIRTVLEAVTKVPSVPVVIAEGSGRAADILAFAHRYIGPSRGEIAEVADVVEHRQLLFKIENTFPEEDSAKCLSLYQQVLKCVANRKFITVFCVDEGDMDKAILRALLKGQHARAEDQLSLALVWNRVDIAKSEIFAEDHKWNTTELEKAMMSALLYNHVDFVELLLENGVSMSHFLTEKRLETLYRKTIDVSCAFKFVLRKCVKCKVNGEFVLSDLCTIMDYLSGLTFQCVDGKQDSVIRQGVSMFNFFVSSPTNETNSEATVRYKFPFKELLVWAVLCNRQKMALFMWEHGDENLAKALIAGLLFNALSYEMSKDDLFDDLSDVLEQNAKVFYVLALGLLDECYHTNETATDQLLTYHLDYWGGQTCLSLAVAMKHKEFVAHSSCQSKMTEVWMGAIRNGRYRSFQVVLGILIPPVILSLGFKSNKQMSSMPVTFEDFQAEQTRGLTQTKSQVQSSVNYIVPNGEPTVQLSSYKSTDDHQGLSDVHIQHSHIPQPASIRISCVKKFYEFHRAPITKFWANLIIYFMFLGLFSYVILLKLEKFPGPGEWVLIGFVVTLLLEEMRQIVQSEPNTPIKKIKEWASNNWNVCDGIAIVLFFVAVGLRFHRKTLPIGHVIYSIDIMLWIIRLLDLFSVNKNLGPYVVMIGRMTVDMFYFLLIMVVFLLAYGVAQQAILFPDQTPTWELIPKIFFRPYFQVYGELFLEDVDYSDSHNETAFETPVFNEYAGRIVTFIMAFFLLVANILLLNLLIAIFNNTFAMIQANAKEIWKFQRYELVMEYAQRPLLVPPFIVLGHVYRLFKACCNSRRKTKGKVKGPVHKLKLFLTKDELYKLMLFEEQCTESFLQKRTKMFHSTQEERVHGIADKVETNVCEIDKLSKVVHKIEDRCRKLEEYTMQILNAVAHIQISIPGSLTDFEVTQHDCDDHELSMGQHIQGDFQDRYTIDHDHTAPVLDRMVSMPAYMHQKVPRSPRMYFRNKLPLTNPYQYRKQFNSGAHALPPKANIKRVISRFRRNTLPRADLVPALQEKISKKVSYNEDDQDGISVTSSEKSSRKQRAGSSTTVESLEVPQTLDRPRSSSMPCNTRGRSEYDDITSDHNLHIRARQSPYPNSNLHRYPVPDFLVDWQIPFPGYFPLNYSDPLLTANPPWADVDISDPSHEDVQLDFNSIDKGVDRRSHIGFYDLFDGLPRNPMGRTGMGGRGLLGRWGPNHAADPIVTRWMKNEKGIHIKRAGKRVLEFVAIQRQDCKQWAIPGGMVEVGETISETLKREFCEEAMNYSLAAQSEKEKKQKVALQQFFEYGMEVYKGYVDDPRNTDNAWMETVAINFHDETGNFLGEIDLKAGDDACGVRWQEVSSHGELYANHSMMLQRVAEHHGAYF